MLDANAKPYSGELVNATLKDGQIKRSDTGDDRIYRIPETVSGGIATMRHDLQEAEDKEGNQLMMKSPHIYNCPHPYEHDIEGKLMELLNEAWTLNKLRHPNIVKLVDFTLHEQEGRVRPSIIMEKVPGEQLNKKFLETLNFEEKMSLIETIAKPIDFTHQQGFVIRDLGPRNIMSTKEVTKAKLIDFETAVKIEEQDGDDLIFRAGFAPKTIIEKNKWTVEDELWAYTAIAYYILTDGKYPFGFFEDVDGLENSVCEPTNLEKIESIRGVNTSLNGINKLMQDILNERDHSLNSCSLIAGSIKNSLV